MPLMAIAAYLFVCFIVALLAVGFVFNVQRGRQLSRASAVVASGTH